MTKATHWREFSSLAVNRHFASGLALATGAMLSTTAAFAQQVSPVTVTPQSLAPEQRESGFKVDIPQSGALQPPAGSEAMAVTLGEIRVEGSFPEVADEVAKIVAPLRHANVTLAQVYAAASQVEAAHARAGYILARVSVPPQTLSSQSDLLIKVTDGFIETVDISQLPSRVQRAVKVRTKHIENRRHLAMDDVEQALMIASTTPGLTLRSTLMRGDKPDGAKLILEGTQQLVTGSFGVDNLTDPSLGRWAVNLQVALNSALGLGEQFYGFVSSDYDVTHIFNDESRQRVLGGGVVVPLGDGRFSLNPEMTFARTSPDPMLGAPRTVGTLRRLTLRANQTLVRTRHQQVNIGLTAEQIKEKNSVPQFGVDISHNRYVALRINAALNQVTDAGSTYGATLQFSQGLGNLAAITLADSVASNVPFSRMGARNSFSKLTAGVRGAWALGADLGFSLNARAQTSFGRPVFRAEQAALEGADGLSVYVGGRTAVDAGIVARGELSVTNLAFNLGDKAAHVAPYGFVAGGAGRLEQPTQIEWKNLRALVAGAGVRAALNERIGISVEYAHGVANDPYLDRANRINVSTTLRF